MTGYTNKINAAGVQYYKNLINELRANNIEPLVTMYHWDLPQPIQDAGGWPNPYVIEWFTEFARICFEEFGSSVKYWMTFNEPKQICHLGYGTASGAPAIKSPQAEYICSHNVLLAHASVYHLYNQTYRKTQNGEYHSVQNYETNSQISGQIGFVIDTPFFQPGTNRTIDVEAAETQLQFNVRHMKLYLYDPFKDHLFQKIL